MGKGRWWLGKGANDHEAGSSRRSSRSPAPPALPPPPPPDAAPRAAAPPAPPRRVRPYLSKRKCQWYWDNAIPVPWPDVHLFEGWHLNPERIPVPPVPKRGLEREVEILRRRDLLSDDLRHDPAYAVSSSNWDTWFHAEHDQRRRGFFGVRHASGPPQYPPPSPPHGDNRYAPPPPLSIKMEEDGDAAAAEEEERALAQAIEESKREAKEAAAEEERALAAALAAVAAQQDMERQEARQAMEEEEEDRGEVPDWFMPLVGRRW